MQNGTEKTSHFGREIIDSLSSRLDKLEQTAVWAATFIPKDGSLDMPSLDMIIKKTHEKPVCLEMLQELAQEEPTTAIYPKTIVSLLGQKINELKKAQAAMAEASY